MTVLRIGGIQYPNDGGFPASGAVAGFCCNECRDRGLELIRNGEASIIDGPQDEEATRRFQVLEKLGLWGEPVPPKILTFLLRGGEITSAHREELVALSRFASIDGDVGRIRVCAVYCFYLADNASGEYAHMVGEFRDTMATIRGVSSSCVACGVRRGDYLVPQHGSHCAACRSRLFIPSTLMNEWIARDTPDLIHFPYDHERDTEEDTVTLEWAENNLDFDEETETWERNMPERLRLMSYSANPLDQIDWDTRNKSNALVFGVELEFEPNTASETGQRSLIRALGGNKGESFILKGDGSLTWGVELVTTPFTLSQHKDGTGVNWKKITEKLAMKAHSGTVTDHCGMHVHINKKALSALTIGKMLVFLNDSKLAPLITTIAQRASGGYCSRSAKKLTDGTRSSESRYDIMNVSVRHPTCELRMFRGNLALERIYKNIEFCHALVQYCRQASMRSLADWGNFSRWLIEHRGQYQNLVHFLIDKETIGFRQLAKNVKLREEIKHIEDI